MVLKIISNSTMNPMIDVLDNYLKNGTDAIIILENTSFGGLKIDHTFKFKLIDDKFLEIFNSNDESQIIIKLSNIVAILGDYEVIGQ